MRTYLWLLTVPVAALACACIGPNTVLTPADLSDQYPGFSLNSSTSGPQTRDQVVNAACDPKKQASELDETHWVAEYINEYDSALAAISPSRGTAFLILSEADLFQAPDGAAVAVQDSITDDLAWANTECKGLDIGHVRPFDFPTIGDESWGVNVSFTDAVGSETVSGVLTIVISRKGEVLVSESIARFGDTGAPDEAVRLTRLVVDRMD